MARRYVWLPLPVGTVAVKSSTSRASRFSASRERTNDATLSVQALLARRRRIRGPVVVGPLHRVLVCGVDAEIEDVLLRDADVLEQLPRRVLEAGRAGAAPVGRDPVDGLVESDMRVLPVEERTR